MAKLTVEFIKCDMTKVICVDDISEVKDGFWIRHTQLGPHKIYEICLEREGEFWMPPSCIKEISK